MTIIQSKDNNKKINQILVVLSVGLILTASAGVVLYSRNVSLAHDIFASKSSLRELEVKNSEIKNNFYALSDNNSAERALGSSFVLEKNPEYVRRQQVVINN